MRGKVYAILFGGACLGIGFALGRRSAPDLSTVVRNPPAPTRASLSVSPKDQLSDTKIELPRAPAGSAAVRTYAWIKQSGTSMQVMPFAGDTFSIELAIMLGLTKDEYARLNTAISDAKKRMDDAALRTASGQVSADGQTLTVSVPPLPEEGGAAYSQLLDAFKRTLGPERFQLFSELTGDGFEQSFDRFGLNPITYELTVKPVTAPGITPIYTYKRRYTDSVNTGGSGWSSGALSRADIERSYPALARFLPPGLQ